MVKISHIFVEKLPNSQLFAAFFASNEELDARKGKSRTWKIFPHFFLALYPCKELLMNVNGFDIGEFANAFA